VRKHRIQIVTVGFILVLLIQRVCGWGGPSISSLWFHRLLMFLVLVCRRVDLTTAGSHVSGCSYWLPLLACPRAAAGSLVALWTRREFGLSGLGKRHRSQTRVNKLCSPGQRFRGNTCSLLCLGRARYVLAQIVLTVKDNARKLPSSLLCFTPSAEKLSTRLHPNA